MLTYLATVTVPASMFMEPTIKGAEFLKACCYSFLIKHDNPDAKTKHDTMVFDLGVRKDFENSPKAVVDQVTGAGMTIPVEKNVIDILKDNGEDPAKVGGIIWSHWHLVSNLKSTPKGSSLNLLRTTQVIHRLSQDPPTSSWVRVSKEHSYQPGLPSKNPPSTKRHGKAAPFAKSTSTTRAKD